MAFQRTKFDIFCKLLKNISRTAHAEDRAVAENFLLEERLTAKREDSYAEKIISPADVRAWIGGHGGYIAEKINVYLGIPETFTDHNKPNLFPAIDENQYLVRLENITWPSSLMGRDVNQMIEHLNDFLKDRTNSDFKNIIEQFLNLWNTPRDHRPIFASFWGEVKDIFTDKDGNIAKDGNMVKNDDWANQIRDRFGLGHYDPMEGENIPVALMRYRVSDVLLQANHGASGTNGATKIAAIPTVLDSDWGPFFFPTPVNGWNEGQTLDLSPGGKNDYSFNFEIVHRFIKYQPSYLFCAGWITKSPGKTCEEARKMHLELFGDDFKNINMIR